ncbi:MAG: metallophosphoesterase, partial [Chloroflexi bacterium]|nr:metallophosphoesterase [Chloroflexota bacterium]
FTTFPSSGAFTFVVLSDTQDELPLFSQYERYKLIADRIAAEPDIAFVINAGDLVDDGSDPDDWSRYFEASRLMASSTTVYPALGNHEENSALYYDAFGVPEYYSFDCGDAHFAVLDSNTWAWGALPTQTAWLESDLDSSQTWKFIFSHYPLYTSEVDHFGGWANLRDEWEAIFISHGVDAVWSGDVHAYERYVENGIAYFVTGTGGGPSSTLSEVKCPGYQSSLENSLAYARVTVDPDAGTATVEIIRV